MVKKVGFRVELWETEMPVDVALSNDEWQWMSVFWFSFLILDSARKVSISFLLIKYTRVVCLNINLS